jgi:hypothetical protein
MATSAVIGVPTWVLVFFALVCASAVSAVGTPYFGKSLGSFKTYNHGVKGDLFAVDSRTILIKGFSYDGQGPDAFFWAGNTAKTSADGFIVPDEKGTINVLKSYNNQDLVLTLPDGKTLDDIKWLAVWCRSFAANFGDLFIPVGFEAPAPQRLDRIVGTAHNTSTGPIIVVDSQTFMVPKFYVDGQAPDAHFWAGKGSKPTADGILVPDENGSEAPLGRYDGQTVVIELPGDLTVFDIDWFSVWCRQFEVDFGHIKIPKNLNVPPSLKVLGSSPQGL